MSDDTLHIVSFSGGKDSTAMLLHMLELNMPVDEIIFCDTGVEFPQMYEHIDKVEQYICRKITRLKAKHDYPYMLLEYKIKARDGSIKKGYSFTDIWCRWCTAYFKRDLVKRYLRGKGNFVQYIGIAVDEPKRIHDDVYPLVEWGWTEADCLRYCYEHGFDWGGLYEKFNRVSCWCCPLQNLKSLKVLRRDFPDLWATLLDWQHKTWRKFRADYSVDELDARFAREDEMERMQVKLDFGGMESE